MQPDVCRAVLVGGSGPLGDRLAAALDAGVVRGGPAEVAAALAAAPQTGAGAPACLVYLAAERGRRGRPDPADAAAVLRAAAGSADRVLVVASTEIYRPTPQHPGLLDEARFNPRPGDHGVADRWLELERAVEAASPGASVLRAAPVPLAGGTDYVSRLLTRRLALTLPGHDPSIQLLAAADLADAVRRALATDGGGPWNVVPAGTVPLRQALRLAGVRRLPVPRWLQSVILALRPGRTHHRLDSLRWSWTADGGRAAEELGFVARQTSAAVAQRLGARRRGEDPEALPPAPTFDALGMSPAYIDLFGRTLFPFLHDVYWRVEHRGLEHVPRRGRVVLAGVHRGFMPWDGVMALHLLRRETGRIPRFLLHPTLVKFPFLFNYMTKLGGVMACQENAARVLEAEGMLGIFPEGINGAFTPYRRAYELGRFGRDEFVRMALRSGAPILPFVTVGSAEIYPILGRIDWSWWKRYSLWPYFPITPTFPWFPLPLPSKWHTRFLEPLHVEERFAPEAADDRRVVGEISREVRRRMEEALGGMLRRRRSIFWGSVFDEPSAEDPVEEAV